MIIRQIDLRVYFLLFIVFSVMGWCIEVVRKYRQLGRFINRGFLIGPYCPIYGCGAILVTLLLRKYIGDPMALFIMTMILAGTLEYVTSYLMEKLFKARWWDYSKKKFNVNGRICLSTLLPFGMLGFFVMYVFNPFFFKIVERWNDITLNVITLIIFIIFIVDYITSFSIILYVKRTSAIIGEDLDNTEEITKKVKEILINKSILHKRLILAYPMLETIKTKVKKIRKRNN